jgi:hypothetical protein
MTLALMTQETDPLFICRFANGHESCVSVFCSPDALDLASAMKRSRGAYKGLYAAAYECSLTNPFPDLDARALFRERMHGDPPPIVSARFEFNGKVLATYDAATLAAIAKLPTSSREIEGDKP